MSTPIKKIIQSIKDSLPAKISLVLNDRTSVDLKCIYKESASPLFLLVFAPKVIPENIDYNQTCSISITDSEPPVTLSAMIRQQRDDRTLELVGQKTIDPATMREYFRVDMRIVVSTSYEPGPNEITPSWALHGQTIDVSASGLLAIFPGALPNLNHIRVTFETPHNNKTIHCMACVIRQQRLRKQKWKVSLHFESIEHKDRDHIISSCLKEQRKQLKEKVQTISS